MPKENKGKIIIPSGANVWPHELRVARILAAAGHKVEFIKAGRLPMPDIYLDGIEYEIKSPEYFNPNTLEHTLKDALKQSLNLIIDTSRLKKIPDQKVCTFLIRQMQNYKQIKRLLMVTKQEKVVDIMTLV